MRSWYQKEKKIQADNMNEQMEIDSDIVDFLAELELLHHVPFPYLLPADDMLKEEQMCFFYLDAEWIRCIKQGALSIGCVSRAERAWNQKACSFYESAIKDQSCNLRGKIFGLSGQSARNSVRTGFLLRSGAVRCWPGIEVECWDQKERKTEGSKLSILRLERIADDTLLCIVDGIIRSVELSQPPEGIYLEAKNKDESGTEIIFRKESEGVLDIKTMAETLSKTRKATPEEFGALFLHKQIKYIFTPCWEE